ncbi:Uronate isomerase [Moorella glycerini]|uniref:Glucuronate isomerase n=2 Tax=Neomoorella stamsii TaxID=1266720 RepID=A0A9X7P6U4_9FIRM|nr:hypothetical protein MOST_09380 [Moorella stamsii]CEP67984.1 Uronate isomerase [Moorella glycerini]
MAVINQDNLTMVITKEVERVQVTDIHTHLYPPGFGDMFLYGIDELLTYHYLIAEFFRYATMDYEKFFSLSKMQQAELIYQTLFIKHSPVSEAQRGVLTVLKELGLDVNKRDLRVFREQISIIPVMEYVNRIFALAGVKEVIMTNDPFDSTERQWWEKVGNKDPRFKAALRLDPLLNDYEKNYKELIKLGYRVDRCLDENTISEIKRYLKDWVKKINAVYMAVSLPPDFTVPEDSYCSRILELCVLPICKEVKIPLALMIGVKRSVNPYLGLAADSLGKADIRSIEYLCRTYPENKFLVTMLSKENQHELVVTARKFRNLMVFGCWWFLNNPDMVKEITSMRLDTLGLSFIPQHSDARVLEHLIYKWVHFRKIIAGVLTKKYQLLLENGWRVTEEEIKRDIEDLFSNNFWNFVGRNS